jgi:hypothetical protein
MITVAAHPLLEPRSARCSATAATSRRAAASRPASTWRRLTPRDAFRRSTRSSTLCNHVSLATGLPISVVDLDLGAAPWSIAVCPPGTTYVFNPAGQTIDASGLLALHDAAGPCGTPVKDAQRTKTSATTRAALAIVWGTRALPGRTARAVAWYRSLAAALGTIEDVALSASP